VVFFTRSAEPVKLTPMVPAESMTPLVAVNRAVASPVRFPVPVTTRRLADSVTPAAMTMLPPLRLTVAASDRVSLTLRARFPAETVTLVPRPPAPGAFNWSSPPTPETSKYPVK